MVVGKKCMASSLAAQVFFCFSLSLVLGIYFFKRPRQALVVPLGSYYIYKKKKKKKPSSYRGTPSHPHAHEGNSNEINRAQRQRRYDMLCPV